jgi:uncharacterized protein YggT (Ycf19 family)
MSIPRTQNLSLAGCVLRGVPIATGALEALLLARLLARLLAARPDNPAIQLLYALTDPLVMPLRALDAQQPQFGAVLELSTLALLVVVPVVGYVLWYVVASRRGKTRG